MSVAADLQLGAFLATSLGTTKAFAFLGNPGARKKKRERGLAALTAGLQQQPKDVTWENGTYQDDRTINGSSLCINK